MADEDEAAEVRQIWSALGLPGVIDVHTHFMPKSVMDKVWQYFDSAGPLVGREWPINYRTAESERVQMLRQFGVRGFTALVYPHKPQMAAWLNQWAVQFARFDAGLSCHRDVLSRTGRRRLRRDRDPRWNAGLQSARSGRPIRAQRPDARSCLGSHRRRPGAGGDPLRFRAGARRAHRPRADTASAAALSAAATGRRAHGNAGVCGVSRHLR